MKNIIAFVGSLQKNSINRRVFEVYQALSKNDFNFIEVKTSDFPHYNQDIFDDVLEEVVTPYANAISKADGIIFFSPEYNYSIPGHLKNAIDWISRHPSLAFNNKKASIIGASPSKLGTGRMQYDLRKTGVYLNLHFLNKPEIMISEAHKMINADGKLIDEGTINFLKDHAKEFSNFISS